MPTLTDEALRERVKELECLYAIARVSVHPGITLDDMLRRIAKLLPSAWRFPVHAVARITLDDRCVASDRCVADDFIWLTSPIKVRGAHRGEVSVGYPSAGASGTSSPFIAEEQRLLIEIARQVNQIVERRETFQAQEALRDQLQHAERLATIGQLASGVAHELNEPLGGILGFAQLIIKMPRLPRMAKHDLSKIETAALLARDIIRKLMVFARQSPPHFAPVDINHVIQESMGMLMWRCEDGGIHVEYFFDSTLPHVIADRSQIQQIVINLVLNAVQAMPGGGVLRLETVHCKTQATVIVSDTGNGIPANIRNRIFDPFFTTKEPGQGTGLGLSVVHGIIAAHGGRIDVESQPGKGSRFRIRLPLRRPSKKCPPGE